MPVRPALAIDPRRFGRRPLAEPRDRECLRLSDDFRLFSATFAAGFVFVSILIA
jgi:hypothetical protein